MNPLTEQCTARAKHSGVRCKRLVLGGGVCRMHGGASPQVRAKRLQRIAVATASRFTGPVPISGAQALLDELNRTNGLVLELQDALGGDALSTEEQARAWETYRAERGHLKQVAEVVVRLDVDGRLAGQLDQQIGAIVMLLRNVVIGLGLDPQHPEVADVVRRELRAADARQNALSVAREVAG